ncbi:MAG: hypothetical protein JWL99_1654 [Streptomyces oryziradicis]|nr:hypothetical protein [Actinacidiphila oryziradicis]
MARMMGVRAWERVPCCCCNGHRSHGQQRAKEEREWRKAMEEDIELCEWCQLNDAVGLFNLDDVETGLCATCATDNDAEECGE